MNDKESCYSCHYLCWCEREHVHKCSKLQTTISNNSLNYPCDSWKPMKHKIAAKTCQSVADCALGIPWCCDDDEMFIQLSKTEFTHFCPILVGDYEKVPKKWLNETLAMMCLCIAKSLKNPDKYTFSWIERNFGLNPLTKDRIVIHRGTVWYNPEFNTWHGMFKVIRRCSNAI